jgi:hypothetical protein
MKRSGAIMRSKREVRNQSHEAPRCFQLSPRVQRRLPHPSLAQTSGLSTPARDTCTVRELDHDDLESLPDNNSSTHHGPVIPPLQLHAAGAAATRLCPQIRPAPRLAPRGRQVRAMRAQLCRTRAIGGCDGDSGRV